MRDPVPCPDLDTLLAFLDGELAAPTEKRLKDHLHSACPHCQENLDLLRWTRGAGSQPLEVPPPWILERVRAIPASERPNRVRTPKCVYDSAEELLSAGVRSHALSLERFQVWSAEGIEIELKLDPLDEREIMLVGQVVGTSEHEVVAALDVILRQKGTTQAVSRTDESGQFLLTLDSTESSSLTIRFVDGLHVRCDEKRFRYDSTLQHFNGRVVDQRDTGFADHHGVDH